MDQSPIQNVSVLHKNKHRLIAICILASVLIVAGILVKTQLLAPTCFTASDYKKIYGGQPGTDESFGPGKPFYTVSYEFMPDTATILTDDGEEATTTAEASIYNDNPRKQMRYTISAGYDWTVAGQKTLATKRADAVKSLLVKAGVPQAIITSTIFPSIQQSTDEQDDDEEITPEFVSLTIASDAACRE